MKKTIHTLWGANYTKKPGKAVLAFTAGRDVHEVKPADYHLLPFDLWVNQAHCLMLAKQKIISTPDATVILKGLQNLEQLITTGQFTLDPEKEDVHTNIESWLIAHYGIEACGKLHTARSRNDQVVTDMRLYLRDQVLFFVREIINLAACLLKHAVDHNDTVMPGFTHHQHAMVTTWGHTVLGFATMVLRDVKRFTHWFDLHNQCPLGDAVSYGTTFPLDRELTAKLLGFDRPDVNSLDAITTRGEAEADMGFALVALMNHMSAMAETLILFSTQEFDMLKIADEYSTGSSIMPQKKNPHPLEVVKGKTSYAQGQLAGLLGLGKANFIGYNAESQWSKYLIMDMVEECKFAPQVLQGVIETITINQAAMEEWSHKGFIGTTTLQEQIVTNYHIPFRQAKVVVEKAVKYSQGEDKVNYAALYKALKEEWLEIKVFRAQVRSWQDPKTILELTKSRGGPGIEAQEQSANSLYEQLKVSKKWLQNKQLEKQTALEQLYKEIGLILQEES